MDYSKYYQARNIVEIILEKDLVGPLDEDEIINDYPVSYYMAGKLYPQECRFETNHVSSEDLGETDDEQELQLDEGYVPSSMGMSFSLSSNATIYSAFNNVRESQNIDEANYSTFI